MMFENRQIVMKIMKLIEKKEGMTVEKLAELLDKDVEEVKQIIERLKMRGVVEENNGILNTTENIKEFKKGGGIGAMEYKKGRGHKEHKEMFMYILKNNGISKDELSEKTGKSIDEIDLLLKHFESKGVIEIKDGKIYAVKEAIKRRHRR